MTAIRLFGLMMALLLLVLLMAMMTMTTMKYNARRSTLYVALLFYPHTIRLALAQANVFSLSLSRSRYTVHCLAPLFR